MFSSTLADRPIQFISQLKLTGDFHGRPFRIMPWCFRPIRDVFGTVDDFGYRIYRYLYLTTAKKNSKSLVFAAAIPLYQLLNRDEPHGEIVLAAGSREQARKDIYEPLVEMITQTPDDVQNRLKITDSLKHIVNKETGTNLQVISADAPTKHGWNLTLCVIDELHVQPNRILYDILLKGAGLARRQPLWIFTTTAGDDPDRTSIAWEVHEKARSVLNARRRNGDKTRDIPEWYPVIHTYEGDDIYNERNWKRANPSLGVTFPIEELRKLAHEASLRPADERLFRWLNLNQWVTTKLTSWLPLDLWDAARGTWTRSALAGEDCYLGGDFSTTLDLSSVCLIFPPQANHADWRFSWENFIPSTSMQERIQTDHVPYDQWAAGGWVTPTPGDTIDYTLIEAHILELKNQYNIIELGADTHLAVMLLQRLEQAGLTCSDVQQTYKELTDPMNYVEILLREGKATHDGNPCVRWAFGNTSTHVNGSGQKKYVKEHRGHTVVRTKRIDPIAALICGMARAKFYDTAQSVYETRGLKTV